ncbi:MAG: DUF1456 family protein [Candidatus Omnitrophica bacterium]|nr:DUF1456 family protein [Candidatus Omnitrophota bacterium]
MINNDILRRLRYALKMKDLVMVEIFKLMEHNIGVGEILDMLRKEEDERFLECSDHALALFLDGLIIYKRGKREDQVVDPKTHSFTLDNNEIFKKLRIALKLKDDDIVEILKLVKFNVTKSEINALFRKKGHQNFKKCGDQLLRNFLLGLTKRNAEDTKKL